MVVQAAVEHDQRGRFPPPGQLVDIGGGEKIHLRTWGSASDRPTVLLFISAQTPSSAWAWIAQSLAEDYRVVAFDRSGMGWSTGGSGPRDADHAARALTSALAIAGIGPPYVVVAHSYGGFSARVFVGLHPDDVVAMVLLDTSHPDAPGSGYGPLTRITALQGHAGLMVLFPPGNGFASLPDGEGDAAYAASLWTSHLDASSDELDTWNASAAQVRTAGTFGDLRLLVVAAYESEDQRRYQLDLVNLSSAGEFVALNVGHLQMLTEPDQAALVTDEMTQFLAAMLR